MGATIEHRLVHSLFGLDPTYYEGYAVQCGAVRCSAVSLHAKRSMTP